MKKMLFLILSIFLCIPSLVNAWDVEIEQEIVKETPGVFKSMAYEDKYFYAVGYFNSAIDGLEYYGGYDTIVVKYNENGELIWQKTFSGSGDDYFYDCVLDSEGNLIVVGSSNSTDINGITNLGSSDGILVKYDKDGNVLYKMNWGGSNSDVFKSITIDNDGNIVLSGSFNSRDISYLSNVGIIDAMVLKFDKEYNLLCFNSWGGNHVDSFDDIQIDSDNNIVLIGSSRSEIIEGLTKFGDYDALIVKYDENGKMLWQKVWGGSNEDVFYGLTLDEFGNIFAVGYYRSVDIENVPNLGNYDGIIVKYDKDGNLIWQHGWGGTSADYLYNVSVDSNNDLVVVGRFHSQNVNGITKIGNYDGVILIYDQNGVLEWQKSFGTQKYDAFLSITRDSKYNFITVGEYDSKLAILRFYKKFEITNNDAVNGSYEVTRDKNEILLNASPDDNYVLEKIIINDEEVTLDKSDNGYYYQLKDDSKIDILFARDYQLNLNKVNNGVVTLEKIDLYEGRVKAIADDGYKLGDILIKNSKGEYVVYEEKDGYYYFDVNDDLEVTVLFDEIIKEEVKGDTDEPKNEEENPKTADAFIYYACAIVCSLFGIWSVEQYRKTKKEMI